MVWKIYEIIEVSFEESKEKALASIVELEKVYPEKKFITSNKKR